jgi:hypothetical protein
MTRLFIVGLLFVSVQSIPRGLMQPSSILPEGWQNPCSTAPLSTSVACDTSKSIDERVNSLISYLTPDDKVHSQIDFSNCVSVLISFFLRFLANW